MALIIQAPSLQVYKFTSSQFSSLGGTFPVLVVGFRKLSHDFMVLCDFLGPEYFLASFGKMVSLVLAKMIIVPFRDAVFPNSAQLPVG